MALIIKEFRKNAPSDQYSAKAIVWCQEHCGSILEKRYVYGFTSATKPYESLRVQDRADHDQFILDCQMYSELTGLPYDDVSDIELTKGENWWHFDRYVSVTIVQVTVLPDDVTAVHFKLMVS